MKNKSINIKEAARVAQELRLVIKDVVKIIDNTLHDVREEISADIHKAKKSGSKYKIITEDEMSSLKMVLPPDCRYHDARLAEAGFSNILYEGFPFVLADDSQDIRAELDGILSK